jgi:dipeptidyl aminopeptidase/acylaminoacyl peptidase
MAFRGIVKAPKTFSGAVSINGVSDWYGLIDAIPSSPFKSLFEGVPDTHNLEAYFQASVFTGMENLTRNNKVVVIWGEKDSTVPVWQSTKYIDYAKTKNVSVDTLSFPAEDHIIRKRENLDAMCTQVVTSLNVAGVKCSL